MSHRARAFDMNRESQLANRGRRDCPHFRLRKPGRRATRTYGHASVLAIGNFDGIHLGHQAILRATVERAQALNAVSTALTFDPSPRKVLRPESAPPRISTNAQRMEWFNASASKPSWSCLSHSISRVSHPKNLSSKFSSAICM